MKEGDTLMVYRPGQKEGESSSSSSSSSSAPSNAPAWGTATWAPAKPEQKEEEKKEEKPKPAGDQPFFRQRREGNSRKDPAPLPTVYRSQRQEGEEPAPQPSTTTEIGSKASEVDITFTKTTKAEPKKRASAFDYQVPGMLTGVELFGVNNEVKERKQREERKEKERAAAAAKAAKAAKQEAGEPVSEVVEEEKKETKTRSQIKKEKRDQIREKRKELRHKKQEKKKKDEEDRKKAYVPYLLPPNPVKRTEPVEDYDSEADSLDDDFVPEFHVRDATEAEKIDSSFKGNAVRFDALPVAPSKQKGKQGKGKTTEKSS